MDLPEYGWFSRAVLRTEAALASRPRLVIANSIAGVKHHVSLGFPAGSIRCLENRIDLRRFTFSADSRNRFRDALAIPPTRTVIALVSRVDPIKGHDVFVRAVARLSQDLPDAEYWCVGDGMPALKASLIRLASDLGVSGRLRWVGDVMDMAAVYSAADVVVSASRSEGFPNVVAEAVACGAAVVATDVGDSARIVGPGGRCVPPGDPEALAAAIVGVLREGMRERSAIRTEFVRRFDPDILLERHERLLTGVAEDDMTDG